MNAFSEIDLILNSDGSIYHLKLLPEDVADTIITVGDPGRVAKVSKYFDKIDVKKSNREFLTHTGYIGYKRITVVSTGIGTDNIDIVLNELDALVNIDLNTRQSFDTSRSLNIIRIGTSGSLQRELPVDSLIASSEAFGLDSLMHYYIQDLTNYEKDLLLDFKSQIQSDSRINPYVASANQELLDKLTSKIETGITLTTPGFFAPQGRRLRGQLSFPNLLVDIAKMKVLGKKITNFEMETAGLYGLAKCLGHKAISFSVILPNRSDNTFSSNPEKIVDFHIKNLLELICDKI